MNINNLLNPQPTEAPRQPPLSPDQQQPQPAKPVQFAVWAVAQYPQQPHFQVPPAPAYSPQRMISQLSWHLPLERSAFNTNYDHGSQWHGQQHQYHVSPSVAQLLPQPVAQPNYNLYQPTAGYSQHNIPQPVTSPQPQLTYYLHAQPQQQQRCLHRTPPPRDLRPEKRQRFDSPNLDGQAQHHAPQPLFEPSLPLAQNTGVYSGQNQGPSRGDGCDTRGLSMAEKKGEIAERGRGSSYKDFGYGSRQAGESGSDIRAHHSEGNCGGAASTQPEGRNTITTPAEPAAIQFQGAHHVNMSGNPTLMNIGMNNGNLTTVSNYGGTHGLESLKEFVSFAALHDSAEQDPDRRCHPGTRKTVLKRLRDWFDNPTATDRIFWLHGPAGAGKSAIAQTIADEYKERGAAATFFFFRSDASRNNGNQLFPTIAWQLAFLIPAVKDFIVHVLDKTLHLLTQRVETQFEQLVAHAFHAKNHNATQMLHSAPVVIIDGVDECSDEQLQRRILTVIGNAVKDTHIPLRFLIVSRPEALIEETLNRFKGFTVSIDLAKLDDSNRDIQKYLEDKFSEIATDRGLDSTWPGQEIIKEIVFKSSGNFIFASVVIRFISDEDYDPEFLLDTVRNLTPRGNMSPFALLDELFLEILKRQRDQDFLKTFLALLVGRISITQDDLHKDDARLMNVSEKSLHTRLRRMRSLLKFEPFIDVYHKSFLDFLDDPSRSGQYHVSKEDGQKRYLELIVDSVVRHVSMAIEQSSCHGTCHPSPAFKSIARDYPPKIALPVEDWQEALKPLLDLQDKLLKTLKLQPCRFTQIMRDLLLHLVFLQGKTHHIAAIHVPESHMNETVTGWISASVTKAMQTIQETDLDSCLSVLLSYLQKTNTIMVVNEALIDHMSSLLAFDPAETASRVRSVADAQKLIDLVDLLTNNESFLGQRGPDAACKAAHLASKLFARVPILPLSPFLNRPARYFRSLGTVGSEAAVEFICQNVLISKVLNHNYILPVLKVDETSEKRQVGFGNVNEQTVAINKWLKESNPNFSTRIRVMLEIARIIRYIHSMDIVLDSKDIAFRENYYLDSNLRVKVMFGGLFAWWFREASVYGHEQKDLFVRCTSEASLSAFITLLDKVCFRDYNTENTSNRLVKDATQLVKRCRAKDSKKRPTMEDVIKEMERWNLI